MEKSKLPKTRHIQYAYTTRRWYAHTSQPILLKRNCVFVPYLFGFTWSKSKAQIKCTHFFKKKPNVHVPSSMVYTSISDEIRVERWGQSLTDRCPQHLTARQDWLRLESWIRVTRWCQGRTIQTTTCSYQQQRDRNVGPIPPKARSYS